MGSNTEQGKPSLQCQSVYIKATALGFAGQIKGKAQTDKQ